MAEGAGLLADPGRQKGGSEEPPFFGFACCARDYRPAAIAAIMPVAALISRKSLSTFTQRWP